MKVFDDIFNEIIAPEKLFAAWDAFKKDKQQKQDVLHFEWNVEENIFNLHRDLRYGRYKHSPYTSFYVQDPKRRHIHKAIVRDRVLHHAVFTALNPLFEPAFIANSFSCRVGKGTHKGVEKLSQLVRAVSKNYQKPCFALKCDVKRFFATVDHYLLLAILHKRIKDENAIELLKEIIYSFSSEFSTLFESKGLPIGNLTSQLFANVYLNEFDQFVKNELHVEHYVRYTDDFVVLSNSRAYLKNVLLSITAFLRDRLKLELHPKKISLRPFHQGIDFLGYVILPHYRLVRSKTKRRILHKLHSRAIEYKYRTIDQKTLNQSLQSYLGVLSHANAHNVSQDLQNNLWYWLHE